VAARGLDLPNLDLVVHADIPKNPEILLHRSGRTGRAGRKGVCTLIVPHNARKRTERLLNNAHITAEWAKPPTVEEIEAQDRERIFSDPSLTEPLTDDEATYVTELLETQRRASGRRVPAPAHGRSDRPGRFD
jgi:ATP-dependent RNA helicase DeaD